MENDSLSLSRGKEERVHDLQGGFVAESELVEVANTYERGLWVPSPGQFSRENNFSKKTETTGDVRRKQTSFFFLAFNCLSGCGSYSRKVKFKREIGFGVYLLILVRLHFPERT